jgi:hypothetical protein
VSESEQTRKTVRKLTTLKEVKEREATPDANKVARLERQLLALKAADLDLVNQAYTPSQTANGPH